MERYLTREYVEDLLLRYGFKIKKVKNEKNVWYKKGNLSVYFEYDFLKFSYLRRYVGKERKSEKEYLKIFLFYSTLSHSERNFLVRNILDKHRTYDFLDYKLYNLENHIKEKIEYINERIELSISVHGEKAKIKKVQTTKLKLENILERLVNFEKM